jgi:hypothetical protein
MKKLPDDKELNMLWSVATSSAIESGTRPHLIFARLLYSKLTNEKPRVGLYDDSQREKGTPQTT